MYLLGDGKHEERLIETMHFQTAQNVKGHVLLQFSQKNGYLTKVFKGLYILAHQKQSRDTYSGGHKSESTPIFVSLLEKLSYLQNFYELKHAH